MNGHWRPMTHLDAPRWLSQARLYFEGRERDRLCFGGEMFKLDAFVSERHLSGSEFQLTIRPDSWLGVVRVQRVQPKWETYYVKRRGGDYGSVWQGPGVPPQVREDLVLLPLESRTMLKLEVLPGLGVNQYFFLGEDFSQLDVRLGPTGLAGLTEVAHGFLKSYAPRAECTTPEGYRFALEQYDSEANVLVTVDVEQDESYRFEVTPGGLALWTDHLIRSLKPARKKAG